MTDKNYTKDDIAKARWEAGIDEKLNLILSKMSEFTLAISDIKERKADKTEFTAYEQRLVVSEKKLDMHHDMLLKYEGDHVTNEILEKAFKKFHKELYATLQPTIDDVKENSAFRVKMGVQYAKITGVVIGIGVVLQVAWLFLEDWIKGIV